MEGPGTLPKRTAIVMQLFSRACLTEESAPAQLRVLIDFGGGALTPQKCDVYEPLREAFDPDDLSAPIRWMTARGGEVKFRRKTPIRLEGYIKNETFPRMWIKDRGKPPVEVKPTVPEPAFCTRWTVWIDAKDGLGRGSDFLKEFMTVAYLAARADYGFMTPESDYQSKNFLVEEDERRIRQRFVGDDPEKGLPGLYWMNLFGPLFTRWFGKDRLAKIDATVKEWDDERLFLQFGESASDSESDHSRRQQTRAIHALGEDAFFDIRRIDRQLRVPGELLRSLGG